MKKWMWKMCGIDSEMVVNLMSLPWLYAVTRDVSNFFPDWRGARACPAITTTDSVDQLWMLSSAWLFYGHRYASLPYSNALFVFYTIEIAYVIDSGLRTEYLCYDMIDSFSNPLDRQITVAERFHEHVSSSLIFLCTLSASCQGCTVYGLGGIPNDFNSTLPTHRPDTPECADEN